MLRLLVNLKFTCKQYNPKLYIKDGSCVLLNEISSLMKIMIFKIAGNCTWPSFILYLVQNSINLGQTHGSGITIQWQHVVLICFYLFIKTGSLSLFVDERLEKEVLDPIYEWVLYQYRIHVVMLFSLLTLKRLLCEYHNGSLIAANIDMSVYVKVPLCIWMQRVRMIN